MLRDIVERLGLVTPSCAKVYFDNLDFSNAPCFKLVLARALSLAVIAGAAVVKVPQILNIARKGAKGLSFASVILELVGYAIVITHAIQMRFSLDAFAESFFVLFQSNIRATVRLI
jgi:hypothetical protein